MTHQDVMGLVQEMLVQLEEENLADFLLPAEGQEKEILQQGGIQEACWSDDFQLLIDETRDLCESQAFREAIQATTRASMELLSNHLKSVFPSESLELKEKPCLPLAGWIPHLSKQVHFVFATVPNHYLTEVLSRPELKALAAITYSAW